MIVVVIGRAVEGVRSQITKDSEGKKETEKLTVSQRVRTPIGSWFEVESKVCVLCECVSTS